VRKINSVSVLVILVFALLGACGGGSSSSGGGGGLDKAPKPGSTIEGIVVNFPAPAEMLKVADAIRFLKNSSPNVFENFVSGKIKKIEATTGNSGVLVASGTYQINESDLQSSRVEWVASTIAHEAVHVTQYKEHRQYFGTSAEIEANGLQEELLNTWGLGYLANFVHEDHGLHACAEYPDAAECS
jgi:hypothetical protein